MRTERGRSDERGVTLIELMVALVVLTIGILAVGALFPAGSRGQLQDRMMTTANFYAQQSIEELGTKTWSDPALTVGRHPSTTGYDSLGTTKKWLRSYQVNAMASPLDNLKKITVTVQYKAVRNRTVTATTYVRR